MALSDAAARAAEAIKETRRRWFIDCDADADGICGGVVIAKALARAGHTYQIRPSRNKDTAAYEGLAEQRCDGYILVDKGSSHLGTLGALADDTRRMVIVIDHHNMPPGDPRVVVVNPRLEGLDGSKDASGATTAAAVALALDDANLSAVAIALSGAVGDWQDRGGWSGWNAELLERLEGGGHVLRESAPALGGATLAESIAPLIDDPNWLADLGLDGATQPDSLSQEQLIQIMSAIVLHDLAAGRQREYVHAQLQYSKLKLSLEQVFGIVDACGRVGRGDAAIGFLLGSPSARVEAEQIQADYNATLQAALGKLRTQGATEGAACQWARTDEAALTGMLAGTAITDQLVDAVKPLVIAATRPDDLLQISCRGTHEQVAHGLNLGLAISTAAQRVGAEGGGHPVASGAVIPALAWDEFIAAFDEELMKQGFLEQA